MSKASATPSHSHFERRYLRAGVRSTATTSPATQKAMVYLVIKPKPMLAPMPSQ